MADTGYNWTTFSEHDAMGAVADGADDTSPVLDLDGKAACQIGLTLAGAAGTVDSVVNVYVLGTVDGTDYETMTNGSPWSFSIAPVASTSVYKVFSIDPKAYPKCAIGISNDSNISVTVTIDVNTATVPVAS